MESLSVWRRGNLMSRIFWPLLLEQILTITIGIVSTILVSNVGPAAVSGVSLVDQFNMIFIAVFNATATGTTVAIAHMIGAGRTEDAGKTAVQSLVCVTGFAVAIAVMLLFFGRNFLELLYGRAEPAVLGAGGTYIRFSAFSFPFQAVFAVSAGAMRASGNSRTPLMCALAANVVNIVLATALIFGARIGVYAVAISMLCARATSGILAFAALKRGGAGFKIPKFTLRIELRILKPVLNVGIPAGVDQLMLHGVRVAMASFISTMGTPSLQANSISNSMNLMICSVALAFSIMSPTVAGQAFGARDYDRVRRATFRIFVDSTILQGIVSAFIIVFFRQISSLYHPTPEALEITWRVMRLNVVAQSLLWTGGFTLAQILRSIGEAKFSMKVSAVALITVRLVGAWFLGVYFKMGVQGIWVAMYLDWVVRCSFFIPRFLSKGWQIRAEKAALERERAKAEGLETEDEAVTEPA